jgi:hypothetical protein
LAPRGGRATADIDPLRTVAAVVFLFFVPGFFLWKALVPRPKDIADEFAAVYTAAFSMALSIAAVVLTGIVLGSLPPDPVTGRGHIVDWSFPALLALSAAAAGVAWYRGAFPWLGRYVAALGRQPKPPPDGTGVSDDPKRYWREQELSARRVELRAQLKRIERSRGSGERADRSAKKAEVARELSQLDAELQALRDERDRAIEKAEVEAEAVEVKRRARRDATLRALRLKRAAAPSEAPGEAK